MHNYELLICVTVNVMYFVGALYSRQNTVIVLHQENNFLTL